MLPSVGSLRTVREAIHTTRLGLSLWMRLGVWRLHSKGLDAWTTGTSKVFHQSKSGMGGVTLRVRSGTHALHVTMRSRNDSRSAEKRRGRLEGPMFGPIITNLTCPVDVGPPVRPGHSSILTYIQPLFSSILMGKLPRSPDSTHKVGLIPNSSKSFAQTRFHLIPFTPRSCNLEF